MKRKLRRLERILIASAVILYFSGLIIRTPDLVNLAKIIHGSGDALITNNPVFFATLIIAFILAMVSVYISRICDKEEEREEEDRKKADNLIPIVSGPLNNNQWFQIERRAPRPGLNELTQGFYPMRDFYPNVSIRRHVSPGVTNTVITEEDNRILGSGGIAKLPVGKPISNA